MDAAAWPRADRLARHLRHAAVAEWPTSADARRRLAVRLDKTAIPHPTGVAGRSIAERARRPRVVAEAGHRTSADARPRRPAPLAKTAERPRTDAVECWGAAPVPCRAKLAAAAGHPTNADARPIRFAPVDRIAAPRPTIVEAPSTAELV